MASVNKQSLREEFDALEGRFEQLVAGEKMTGESRALVEALLMWLQLLMAVFLEKHTPKTSANSGKPSSQTPKDDESALSRPGHHSKGQNLDQARSANTRTVESVRVLKVSVCEHCGEDLSQAQCRGHERRSQIDIVFEKVVVHVKAEIKRCPTAMRRPERRYPKLMCPSPKITPEETCA